MKSLPSVWRKTSERYSLIGTICRTCGKEYFPKRKMCPECRRKGKLEEKAMPHFGKILSFTEVFAAPRGFEFEVPYVMAIIELPNEVKLLTQIVDCNPKKLEIGQDVEMAFRKVGEDDKEDIIAYSYKFRPV